MSIALLIIVESIHGSSENIIDVSLNLLAMDFAKLLAYTKRKK